MTERQEGALTRLSGGTLSPKSLLALAVGGILIIALAFGVGIWRGMSHRPGEGAKATATLRVDTPVLHVAPVKSVTTEQPPAPPKAAAPVRTVTVDSHATGRYPLSEWAPGGPPSGYLDITRIAGSPPEALNSRPLKNDDVLELVGWAGDHDFGLRLNPLIVAVCGEVVASAPVDGARPDVAKAVHRNLGHSGWQVRLLVADLPRCAKPELSLWGAVPGTRVLRPLVGVINLVLPPAGPPSADIKVDRRPLDRPPVVLPVLGQVEITVGLANLRKCGDTSCKVVTRLRRGAYGGLVIDHAGDWSLITTDKGEGWLANSLFHFKPGHP